MEILLVGLAAFNLGGSHDEVFHVCCQAHSTFSGDIQLFSMSQLSAPTKKIVMSPLKLRFVFCPVQYRNDVRILYHTLLPSSFDKIDT